MGLISPKDFVDFLLVTSDMVRWAKDYRGPEAPHGIPMGPGRGSVAASVVAWILRITEVDPYRYPNLLFERFIDVTRSDPPDIDLDISDEHRYLVRDYMADRYGADCVATVANFVRYRGKNSLADVARVYNVPSYAKEIVSGLVIERSGGDSRFDATLGDTIALFPAAQEVFDQYPDLWKATRLEGNMRGMSVHAAGLIVTPTPITDICAIYERDGRSILSIDKYDVDSAGMLKMDILGLSTMGVIANCLEMTGLTLEDLYAIPDDDPSSLDLFKRGDVVGIFQYEGRATRLINRDVSPDNFGEVVDINALSRPGPLFSGTTAEYVDVKHGRREPERYHDVVTDITKHTNGQIIYQEQILQIVRVIGGFDWTNANEIRRIISKKIGEAAFNVSRGNFVEGAERLHGINEDTADRIWKRLVTSGTYAFCCTGETVLEKGGRNVNSSQFITVRELHDAYYSKTPIGDKLRYRPHGRSITLQSMGDDGRIRPSGFLKIEHPRPRAILKITTETGRTLRCSREHRVMTPDGYQEASELWIGEEIVVGLSKEQKIKTGPNYHATGGKWGSNVTGDRTGPDNPGWIDGRSHYLKEAMKEVTERSGGKCEHCKHVDGHKGPGGRTDLDFAHILTLESLKGNLRKYHSANNAIHLCHSCHRKFDYQKGYGKRSETKRDSNGRPTGTERIVSVIDDGVDLVYDISMEYPNHNYLTNGIVSHNVYAHSVSYAILALWTAWLKAHYPLQFYAAHLAKTEDKEQRFKLMKDAQAHGFLISPPKLGVSRASWTPWLKVDGQGELVAGWRQIPGIGEITAKNMEDDAEENGTFQHWSDMERIKGIGPKTVEKIQDFANMDDPFELKLTGRRLDKVKLYIRSQNKGNRRGARDVSGAIPYPTHDGARIAAIRMVDDRGSGKRKFIKGPALVYVGIVRERAYQDAAENIRSRSGEEMEDILKAMKRPDLLKYCSLRCFDETDEEIYVRINRFNFPRMRRWVDSIQVNHDVVVCQGNRIAGFGTPIMADRIWVIDPDD
jgi:hypothetical protein